MIALVLAQVTSARNERLQGMQSRFNEPDPQVYAQILVAVGAIVAIFIIIRLLDYAQKRRASAVKAQPMSLYLRVQAQLGLTWWDRWCLWHLARSAGVANPTALLISPVLFDRATQRYLSSGRHAGSASTLASIRSRLFGQAAPLPLESLIGPPDSDAGLSAPCDT